MVCESMSHLVNSITLILIADSSNNSIILQTQKLKLVTTMQSEKNRLNSKVLFMYAFFLDWGRILN